MGLGSNELEGQNLKEFDSFAGFAAHLVGIAARQTAEDHAALEAIGQAVEERAKARVGDYQDAAGTFAAWEELADSTKADRVRQGYSENDPGLRSGAMQQSIEHQATATEAHIGSDDEDMLWFELGTVHQPPRSVLGGALVELTPRIVEVIGELAVLTLEGGRSGKITI